MQRTHINKMYNEALMAYEEPTACVGYMSKTIIYLINQVVKHGMWTENTF